MSDRQDDRRPDPGPDRAPYDDLAYMLMGLGLGTLLVWVLFGVFGIVLPATGWGGPAFGGGLLIGGLLLWLFGPYR